MHLSPSYMGCISFDSYIKPQLLYVGIWRVSCCISFDSYIKPQLPGKRVEQKGSCISFDSYIKPQLLLQSLLSRMGCISFDSYIKPQQCVLRGWCQLVVYLLIPTSNHNRLKRDKYFEPLYIFWFLHQTTTYKTISILFQGCISFDSYIKPQHLLVLSDAKVVVYLLIPTSNHNHPGRGFHLPSVVYLLIPTSNHNMR